MADRPYAAIVHGWLWWCIFVMAINAGGKVETAYRAAQKCVQILWA